MKCFACNEVECAVGVVVCDVCKAAMEERLREQTRYWRASDGVTSIRIADEKTRALQVLDVPKQATPDDIKQAYRHKAKLLHPDHGGKHEDMVKLNKAYEVIVKR